MVKADKPQAPAWVQPRSKSSGRVVGIDITDTPANAVLKLADGNLAAAKACIAMIEASQRYDPKSDFGPFTPLVMLERLEFRGVRIARLFALAKQDGRVALGLLHALRLGAIQPRELATALAGKAPPALVAELLAAANAVPRLTSTP
ncbi:MAG: hypothetical protein WDO24_12710 [Pseudomonadota bacterium]